MRAQIPVVFFLAVLACDRSEAEHSALVAALDAQAVLIATLQSEGDSLAADLLSAQASQADAESRLAALESVVESLGSIDLSYLEAAVAENELAISTLDAELDGMVTESWMSQQDFADSESVFLLSAAVHINTDAIGVITDDYLTGASLLGHATESWVSGQGFASESELALLADSISTNTDTLAELDTRASEHDERISDIESSYASESWVSGQGYVVDLADYVSIDAASHAVIVQGANLFVQSGSGHTDDNTTPYIGDGTGSLTGLGNLVIGYDKAYDSDSTKSGSHNLILGAGHSYTSFGGLVVGYGNTISGEGSLAIGGQLSEASGAHSAVFAGDENVASGEAAVVLGGTQNTGSGASALVLGGASNVASGEYAAVLGGQHNEASGYSSAIGGGYTNHASNNYTTVGGGGYNTASGVGSAVAGGLRNEASHVYSIVVGGSTQTSSSAYDVAD